MNIRLEALTKIYGRDKALDDVSLEIAPGECIAILGSNGAGKSTLLNCMSGIVLPDTGKVFYDNELFKRENLEQRRRFVFLPDFPFTNSSQTILQHIGMVIKLYKKEDPDIEDRIFQLLKDFDLLESARSPINELSRGQTYKAALTAIFTVQPELIMLDEPFASGMDPQGLFTFRREARQALDNGATIIYSTQILDVVEKFSDRVCVMHAGAVRAFDPYSSLEKRASGSDALESLFAELRDEIL